MPKRIKKRRKPVVRRRGGGGIPGDTDTVPAMLTPGEYVIRAEAVKAIEKQFGKGFLDKLNHFDARNRRKGG
tara:strand:+ start:278 stop:493 length:216 start_codon:yes stop_codon:yes gene_type:complete